MRQLSKFGPLNKLLWLFLFGFAGPAFGQTFEQLGPFGTNANRIKDVNKWIAVVGDSVTTGAATGEGIEATIPSLKNLFGDFFASQRFTAAKVVKEAPTRVFYSRAEFQKSAWYKKIMLNFGAKASLRLDSPENSFGYKLGRSWGVHPSDIVIAGQDGARVEDIPWQLSRIFEMKPATLPPMVILSFTANDLCDASVLTKPLEVLKIEFTTQLGRAWHNAANVLRAAPRGTDFLVLAPLDVTTLINNGEIQAKSVSFEGRGAVTCQDIHMGLGGETFAARMMDRTLGLMCPSVTRTNHTEVAKIQRLKDLQLAMIEIWEKQINLLNAQYNSKKMNWTLVNEVRALHFTADDIAHDCFHPSAAGHEKIAQEILKAYPEL